MSWVLLLTEKEILGGCFTGVFTSAVSVASVCCFNDTDLSIAHVGVSFVLCFKSLKSSIWTGFLKACALRNPNLLDFVVCMWAGGGASVYFRQTETFRGTTAVLFDLLLLGTSHICPLSLCLPTAETCSRSLYSCQNI